MAEPHHTTRVLESPFLPSRHGFAFPNAWENSVLSFPVRGKPFKIALRGRCGGMAFSALDYYRIGVDARQMAGRELPDKRSELGRYTMRRQVESLAGGLAVNMARFVAWTFRPTSGSRGAAALTRGREAGAVLAAMAAGNPAPVGLVTANRLGGMGLNHQVVAYAAERDEHGLKVRIYDPNFPRRDDVWLEFAWEGDAPIAEYVGGKQCTQWRGMFVERYAPAIPPGVHRSGEPDGGDAA